MDFKTALELYGTKIGNKYKVGVLDVYLDGNVWVDSKVKIDHWVGHIDTVKELQGVCELWNNKQLEEYGRNDK